MRRRAARRYRVVGGTPLYVYSAAALRERYRALDAAFGGYPHALHYALKANSTLAIARLLRDLGSSRGRQFGVGDRSGARGGVRAAADRLHRCRQDRGGARAAVALGVKAINVESAGELARVEAIGARLGRAARVAIRVNPDIDAKSHPQISTGLKINKFGVPIDEARELLRTLPARRFLTLVAIHVHVGSQITSLDPLRRAAALVAAVARSCGSRRSRSSTSMSAAASACRTTAARCRPQPTTSARCSTR